MEPITAENYATRARVGAVVKLSSKKSVADAGGLSCSHRYLAAQDLRLVDTRAVDQKLVATLKFLTIATRMMKLARSALS